MNPAATLNSLWNRLPGKFASTADQDRSQPTTTESSPPEERPPTYKWLPLNLQRNEFRVLELLGFGRIDGQRVVTATLHNFPFNKHPPYDALSYSWGTESCCQMVLLDGIPHPITKNLLFALAVLTLKRIKYIWIDALCIRQDDPDEKSAQVRRMGTVFQEATRVLVWLGASTNGSAKVMDLMETVDLTSLETGFWGRSLVEAVPESDGFRFNSELQDFLFRDYWNRLWVVQELAMANSIVIMCGTKTIDGDVFERLFNPDSWVRWYNDIYSSLVLRDHRKLEHLDYIFGLRRNFRQREAKDLLSLLFELRHSETTEVVDRVFAILGLAFDKGVFINEPDYNLKPDQLCTLMTTRFIKATASLDLLFLKGSADKLKQGNLPTWACPFVMYDSFFYQERIQRPTAYINGKINELRCGQRAKHWRAADTSLATNKTAELTGSTLHAVGLRLGCVVQRRTTGGARAPAEFETSDSAFLQIASDSLHRIFMLHSHSFSQEETRSTNDRDSYEMLAMWFLVREEPASSRPELQPPLFTFSRRYGDEDESVQQQQHLLTPLFDRELAENNTDETSTELDEKMAHATDLTRGLLDDFKEIFLTDSDSFAGVPYLSEMSWNSEIWLLSGCSMPVFLHYVGVEEKTSRPKYQFQTHGIVDSVVIRGERWGVMDGEAWRRAEKEDFQWISIV